MKITRDMIDKELRFMVTLMGSNKKKKTEAQIRKSAGKSSPAQKLISKLMGPKDVRSEEIRIPREDGTKLRMLVFKPSKSTGTSAGILWIHGGGYLSGSPELEAGVSSFYVNECNCVMIFPDYRLSTEAPYPAALNDCYTALTWLKDNAAELGVRSDQIAVAGGSAGGGLTAALSLYARDKKEVNIAFQMPVCPMLDDRETESSKDNNAPFWDAEDNEMGWKLYLGDLYKTDDIPPYAAPARAADYAGLPPTCTYVGSIEPFCDETVEYAKKLEAAGVPVEYRVFQGGYHGFDALVPKAEVSKKAIEFRTSWFRKALSEYFAPQPK